MTTVSPLHTVKSRIRSTNKVRSRVANGPVRSAFFATSSGPATFLHNLCTIYAVNTKKLCGPVHHIPIFNGLRSENLENVGALATLV